jgi:ClpP class serine protease
MHEDLSGWLANEGVKVTYISAGKYKVEGNDAEPLSDHARARLQQDVSYYYNLFTKDVAAGRNVALERVVSGYGEGDPLTAPEALALGMIDRIETLDQALARLAAEPNPARLAAVAADAELAASLTRLSALV